ncbi:DUF6989 domain-containing protein [Pseudochryseolinea flava]|uniref:DUF6989 domain-containing protein n=1 Tax=Pseudochryseolinea flava TaxID=2059302 RepID=A0A364Y2B7_9BACT|nr:hypothetical protein [Pseudochryseolinea flava]RAW00423.1 hypothetical protein DQQ10_15350 [Pseudochryseolinea flava]
MQENSIPGLNKRTTVVILITIFTLLLWSKLSAIFAWGPISASVITYGLYAFYLGYAFYSDNPLLVRLTIFGTVAGILELVTDYYLVDVIHSLVYPGPGAETMVWSSPLYMPFAWSNVLLQLSFLGMMLTSRYGLLRASIFLCIMGGLYIPTYEHFAKEAGWWYYNANTPMLFNAPIYVIIAEAFISVSLPGIIYYSEHRRIRRTFLLGLIEGCWIFIGTWLAYAIIKLF